MSLLNDFAEFLHDVNVYTLEDYTTTFGTAEKRPSTTPTVIRGYIQPAGGSRNFNLQAVEVETSHVLYCGADVNILDTDTIEYNGERFTITNNHINGVSGISDHKEIGLRRA